MIEFISKAVAVSHPFANGRYDHENADKQFILGYESYKEWLEDIPPADVRPVVRCRECKYNGACSVQWYKFGTQGSRYPDWFCASGKRREAHEEKIP